MIRRLFISAYDYLFAHKILLVMSIVAWILTLMPFVFDGQHGCAHGECGMIVGTNYRDGLWFLAVANTAFKIFPFQMPIYAGATLQGYHYLPNLVSYLLSYIGIPILVSYYKLIPVLYMTSMIALSVKLARKIRDDVVFVGLFLFMTFFGMHLSLFTSLYHTGKIQNTVLINTFQATRILESPHTALAMLMLFATLILIYKKNRLTKQHLGILGLILFVSFGTKFYVAATILMILCLYELFLLFQHKHIKKFIINIGIFLLSTIAAILIFYNPFNSTKSGSIFIFSPFATVHHLIETPTLFNLHNMVLARYYLYNIGWSPRLVAIELFSSALFVLFYFGTRVIGFFQIAKQVVTKKVDKFSLILTIVIFILIACSILFIQKGDWYNPIQFAVPAAFLMNIFAARFLYEIYKKYKKIGITIIAVIVIATLPANFVNAGYLSNPARLVIPDKEMEALIFLKKQPTGSVFVPIEENAESDTAYVSAFTGKQTYINFTNVLQNADIDYEKRLKQVEKLDTLDITQLKADYLYLALNRDQNKKLYARIKNATSIKKIFDNKTVVVYKILKTAQSVDPTNDIVCAQDIKECTDGSFVPRQPPTCSFKACR